MKIEIDITYQPLNKTWSCKYKKNNSQFFEVDKSLSVAIIEVLRKINPDYLDNGELY